MLLHRHNIALPVGLTFLVMETMFLLVNPLKTPQTNVTEVPHPRMLDHSVMTTTKAPNVTYGPTNVREILPAFKNFQSQIRFADRYGLATCVIPKTMSTVLANVMCYLYDPPGFVKNNRSVIQDGYWTRFCEGLNERNELDHLHKVYSEVDWKWFVVVRDPFDRFVSNYVDKCMLERRKTGTLCYDCSDERDVECVVRSLEQRGFRWAEKGDMFPDFFDSHLFPQNWQCDFGSFLNKYQVVHFSPPQTEGYNKMLTEIMDIFRRKSVPEQTLQLISTALNGTTTNHSTNKKPERGEIMEKIRSNRSLFRRIVNLYYFDYILFGYPFPKEYV